MIACEISDLRGSAGVRVIKLNTLKRAFYSLLVVLSIVHAQPAGFLFKKALGGNNHENVLVTKQTLDGGFVLGDVTNSKDGDVKNFKGGSSDVWIVKLNSAGTLQWQKCFFTCNDVREPEDVSRGCCHLISL